MFIVRSRIPARRLAAEYVRENKPLWIQGHWGFQYYMEQAGAQEVDGFKSRLRRGDRLIVPSRNTNIMKLPPASLRTIEEVEVRSFDILTTMGDGTGFYSHRFGPLPYAWTCPKSDRFIVSELRCDVQFDNGTIESTGDPEKQDARGNQ